MVGYSTNPMADVEPVSRTHQYRKVMKPLLERKRRARINRCLDELKDLMMATFQAQGENVSKLEKADILELTVRHLQKMQHEKGTRPDASTTTYADKFKAGFRQCASEATQFLVHVDPNTSTHMLHHLTGCIKHMDQMPGSAAAAPPPLAGIVGPPNGQPQHLMSPNYAQSVGSMDSGEDVYDEDDMYDEAPPAPASSTAAQAAAVVVAKAQAVMQLQREQQMKMHQQQQQQQHQQQHRQLRDMHHRINTPPQSPNIDVDNDDDNDEEDDMPVWRPW